MDRTPEDLTNDPADVEREGHRDRRPRDLALLLLAVGTDPPRARARDQQADRAGADLRRRVLDRLATLDPEPDPDALDAALAAVVDEFGEPTGPTRGVCSQVRREWDETLASPAAWPWLIAEALERTARGDDPRPVGGGRVALRDLNPFGRRAEPSPSPALASALADLERLCERRAELAPAGRSLARVLRAAFLAPVPQTPAHADPELLSRAWRAGVPAVRAGDSPPALDADDLRARGLAVVEALGPSDAHTGPLRDAIRDGSADLHAWALAVLIDGAGTVDGRAATLGLDPPLCRSVLRLAMLPPLAVFAATLDPLRAEGSWTRGDCPDCGSPPALAESRGLEQRRYWRCGLCAAGWEGERLRCPFCGETDHRALHYRYAEGEQDRYRLSLCDSCGGSLKVLSTLAPISAPGLLVAELATVHLDGA